MTMSISTIRYFLSVIARVLSLKKKTLKSMTLPLYYLNSYLVGI